MIKLAEQAALWNNIIDPILYYCRFCPEQIHQGYKYHVIKLKFMLLSVHPVLTQNNHLNMVEHRQNIIFC